MAEDARSRYTKHMIQQAFIELVKEKPFSRIRLKEVCEKAGINHSTFYRYYQDIYDWKEQVEQSCIEQTRAVVCNVEYKNLRTTLFALLESFRVSKEFYCMIASDHFESSVLRKCYEICILNGTNDIITASDPHRTGRAKWDRYYVVYGTIGALECWLEDGMVEPPEQVADYIVERIEVIFKRV